MLDICNEYVKAFEGNIRFLSVTFDTRKPFSHPHPLKLRNFERYLTQSVNPHKYASSNKWINRKLDPKFKSYFLMFFEWKSLVILLLDLNSILLPQLWWGKKRFMWICSFGELSAHNINQTLVKSTIFQMTQITKLHSKWLMKNRTAILFITHNKHISRSRWDYSIFN